MVVRKAVINGSTVENVIVVDGDFELPDRTLVEVPEGVAVGPGWTWDGEGFAAPAPVIPVIEKVSMRQARLALLYAGLIPQVEAAMDALTEPAKSATRIEWEYATELRRDHPMVSMLAAALSLTAQDVDTLFLEASLIA